MIKLLANPPGWYPDTKKHTAIVQKKTNKEHLVKHREIGFY